MTPDEAHSAAALLRRAPLRLQSVMVAAESRRERAKLRVLVVDDDLSSFHFLPLFLLLQNSESLTHWTFPSFLALRGARQTGIALRGREGRARAFAKWRLDGGWQWEEGLRSPNG